MSKNRLAILSKRKREDFFDALNYMHMIELKALCKAYLIPPSGKKGLLIERLKDYFLTGKIPKVAALPAISKAVAGKKYPLKPSTLIVKGAYKNDDKTRRFFQKQVGTHFHFTAFGQDWIMKRWQQGNPPTYAEFAKAWQKEYLSRKNKKATPKKEWAYVNFTQRFHKLNPNASKKMLAKTWEDFRKTRVQQARVYLMMIGLKN